ncbi:hypothetical protein LCGC14_2260110 [marine sediment metagenome]|uniref:Uncharacterized protein n=1 Tax=marine sediment metagenome TaxID=412755 RepID=A0A0F9CZY6_9ZZZZ
MDTEYIKMADCPEIQSLRKYEDGNYFAFFVSGKWQTVVYTYGHCLPYEDGDYAVWLPTQAQLQRMVSGSAEIWGENVYIDALSRFIGFICQCKKGQRIKYTENIDGITSMEQLWLAFVMKVKHNKVWTGDKWEGK